MDINKFQEKLAEICKLGEENGKALKPEQIKECFGDMDLDKSQLIKILQYLKLQGISIEGAEALQKPADPETPGKSGRTEKGSAQYRRTFRAVESGRCSGSSRAFSEISAQSSTDGSGIEL